MKRISKNDIHEMNDIIMELPAFNDLQSRDMIHDVLDTFLEQIYCQKPKELLDTMEFNISPKMQDTFFTNYGIDKKYSKKIKGYLKEDLAYQLEKLFQNKGSREVFRIFGDIFENVFRKINFYNIRVYKVPMRNGFRFEYRLEPLHIADPNNVLTYPQIPVEQTHKYLMELENFKDYTAWPMPTNLVYIQLSIGEEIINNMNTFLDGIRAYGATYLQGKTLPYKSKDGYIDNIHAEDVELITSYFRVEITKKKVPDWNFEAPVGMASYLPYDPELIIDPNSPEAELWTTDRISFLHNMQSLIEDYGKADRASRQEMEALRRRWQFFLKLKEKQKECWHDYDSLVALIGSKYPNLQQDFLYYLDQQEEDSELLFDFYIYIYSIFISGIYTYPEDPALRLNNEWPIDYIDVLFGGLFVEADFLTWYFNPVMDLFIRYFFPIEMEYINDLIPKVKINDKWNAISYDDSIVDIDIQARHTSLHPMPRTGLDHQAFNIRMMDKHSWLDTKSLEGTRVKTPVIEQYELEDTTAVTLIPRIREELNIRDAYDTKIIGSGVQMQRVSGCVKMARTKEYKVALSSLSAIINMRNANTKNN